MSTLLADARKVSRKVIQSTEQAKFETYTTRIQKKILREAASGNEYYSFCIVPHSRQYLAKDVEGKALFVKIAKHFRNLGFKVEYATADNSKVLPRFGAIMKINWR